MARVTREEDRIAQVSHAVWMLQTVRDYKQPYSDLEPGTKKDPLDRKAWEADVERAKKTLRAVVDGESLEALATCPGHLPTAHDRERAKYTVQALKKLGLLPPRGR